MRRKGCQANGKARGGALQAKGVGNTEGLSHSSHCVRELWKDRQEQILFGNIQVLCKNHWRVLSC